MKIVSYTTVTCMHYADVADGYTAINSHWLHTKQLHITEHVKAKISDNVQGQTVNMPAEYHTLAKKRLHFLKLLLHAYAAMAYIVT